MAIITFYSSTEGFSVFAHPTKVRFIKELMHLFPQVRNPLVWDLNLLLNCLMKTPFEPMATCSLLPLTLKVPFLLAIVSAWRVREMGTWMVDPSFTVFSRTQFHCDPILNFCIRCPLYFTSTKSIHLPVFVPKRNRTDQDATLHTLDLRRALAFYLDRTI